MFIIIFAILFVLSIVGILSVKIGSTTAFYFKVAATISAMITFVFLLADTVDHNIQEEQNYNMIAFAQAVQTQESCISFLLDDDDIPTFFYFHNENGGKIIEIEIDNILLGSELNVIRTNLSNKFDFWFLGLGGENVTYTLYIPIE